MRPGTGDDRVLLYKPRNALIPATFPDDPMEPLVDGTMPLPIDATPYEQRRATIAQQETWWRDSTSSRFGNASNGSRESRFQAIEERLRSRAQAGK